MKPEVNRLAEWARILRCNIFVRRRSSFTLSLNVNSFLGWLWCSCDYFSFDSIGIIKRMSLLCEESECSFFLWANSSHNWDLTLLKTSYSPLLLYLLTLFKRPKQVNGCCEIFWICFFSISSFHSIPLKCQSIIIIFGINELIDEF